MIYHEFQTLPLPCIGRIAQIEDDVDVVRMLLVRDEAAVDVYGFIEQGSDLVVYAMDEIFKQILSMGISGKEISYFRQCTVVYSLWQKAVFVEFRNGHLRIFFVSWLKTVRADDPIVQRTVSVLPLADMTNP